MVGPSDRPDAPIVPVRALVLGLGVMGCATVRALVEHGSQVTVTDDRLGAEGAVTAEELGATWVDPPASWAELVADHDGVVPSPGVPERHPVFAAARAAGVPVRSEFDLAAAWDHRPVAMITGTNGKTTVTTLVTEMLVASGIAAVPAGNVEVPLVAAIEDPAPQAFVVEASSFRLTFATAHRPVAACWLNFAPDHLDVHLDLQGYEDAKAQIWANHAGGGIAIANADDPVVLARAPQGERTQTFGLGPAADWRVADGRLVGPDGIDLLGVDELSRDLPHDRSNALAAAATAHAAGASLEGIRTALRAFRSLPHRVELVGEAGGVRWYDDSKATAPHATVAALSGFASAVLIAGGRNKGLALDDLGQLAPHLRGVVAIGEAADEVALAFDGRVPVTTAGSMADAVDAARALAQPGDAVVLSPACASFDWYGSYAERGDDFQRHVRAAIGASA
jgi:UDP-N-acetylmuramoylalanine--D-glutamate ligase